MLAVGLFTDLAKAFHPVDRGSKTGMAEELLRKSRFVQVGDSRSVKCGVPQGSIVGPRSFIVYSNNVKFPAEASG